jgi:ABC-type branched-subunit amino acid transport system ATPase component
MSDLLMINDLTGGYSDTKVVFDVSVSVGAGQVVGVFGRNGVGKTTLCRLVQGSLQPTSGQIALRDRALNGLLASVRRGLGLGYMPQTSMVFDDLTVSENLSLGTTREGPERYFEMFPRLAERLDQPAGTMSGGERKILSFVRAMIEDTTLLVLDEPSEGVQPENISHMADCLKARTADGAGVLLCDQNIGFLSETSSWYLGLDAGRVVLNQSAERTSSSEVEGILGL